MTQVTAESGRVRVSTIVVPFLLVVVIALAALSYVATRASITAGPVYAVPGATTTGTSFTVQWRSGTNLVIIASFTPSRAVRVRSITLTGLDPKNTILASTRYGFWNDATPLPTFSTQSEELPVSVGPRPVIGAFPAAAHSQVFLRLVLQAIADAKVIDEITGLRIDVESWSWAHTTFVPFPKPVKLVPPR